MVASEERRLFGRIDLDDPLVAQIDGSPVDVVEVSVVGFRVQHEARLPPNVAREMVLEWRGISMRFDCSVVRSTLFRLARRPGEKSIYHSGIRILRSHGDAEMLLRSLIAERVIRALEEQKANARGLPPLGQYTYQVGKSDRYVRYELADAQWKKNETTNPEQPPEGFTISAEVDPRHVDMLCETYEMTTSAGRRLTRILAELSIDKNEGIATRRYVP